MSETRTGWPIYRFWRALSYAQTMRWWMGHRYGAGRSRPSCVYSQLMPAQRPKPPASRHQATRPWEDEGAVSWEAVTPAEIRASERYVARHPASKD